MQIPSTLDDWSLDAIKEIIKLGLSENQDFEFKSAKVLEKGQGGATLSKQVSAFANSRGGFLIIGVAEGSPRTLEGVAADSELAKKLNDRIKVYPAPQYPAPRAIPFRNGLSVVVVHIPASVDGPHASIANDVAEFYVRTHSGAKPMNWPAIRDAMIRADERRRQVDVLLGELEQHYLTYRAHRDAAGQHIDFPETHSFELTLTRMALAAIYPWLSKDPHAWPLVSRLMSDMNFVNGQIQAMIADVAGDPKRLRDWRGRMSVVVGSFRDNLIQADVQIRRVFGLPAIQDYRMIYPYA